MGTNGSRRKRGAGRVYLRGTIWWIKYYRHGRPYRESSCSRECVRAERLLKRRLAEIETGQFRGLTAERVRFDELAADLQTDYRINQRKSADRCSLSIKHLGRFFGGWRAAEITTDKIRTYIARRLDDGAANGTINRELATLKRMFNMAIRSGKLRDKPFVEMLKERNVRSGFVDDKEYECLARFYPELWWRAYLAVSYNFGWRKANMLSLRVRQVDLLNQTICLYPGTTKNDEGQTVKMTVEVYELLRECVRRKNPEDHVFTRKNGRPVKDFRGKWRKACLKLGLARMEPQDNGRSKYVGLVIHDLRRSAVRNLERSGVPRSVAMKITGHKTESVYRRYAIVSESDLADAARKLEKRRVEQSYLRHKEPVEAYRPTM